MRSLDAERFDPPLQRVAWVVERPQDGAAFVADAARRFGEPGDFARVLWHGGLQICGHPLPPGEIPERVPAGAWVKAWGFLREPEPVPIGDDAILFDEGGLVAVNKPAWLTTQGSRASQRLSLEAWLRARLGCAELAALHRLDRQTSGVVLFARDRTLAARLGREFAAGRVRKRYLAWVAPAPTRRRFEVHGWLARAPDPARFRFALHTRPVRGGRESRSRFACLAERDGRALLLALPRTGRTHQLRVHLAAIGAPIVGDDLYGASRCGESPACAPRVQLHALALRLRLPDRRWLRVTAAPPACFRSV